MDRNRIRLNYELLKVIENYEYLEANMDKQRWDDDSDSKDVPFISLNGARYNIDSSSKSNFVELIRNEIIRLENTIK